MFCKSSKSVYLAIVNGKEHEFSSKSEMLNYIASFRQLHNEINSLEMYRVDFHSLIK